MFRKTQQSKTPILGGDLVLLGMPGLKKPDQHRVLHVPKRTSYNPVFVLFVYLRQDHSVAQAAVELPKPPEFWDYRHPLPCLDLFVLLKGRNKTC